ncbi:ABC transporter permease subunit [Kineococcus indalonis]|uniref:ABC transporter permease subunit n=1 Tax=Kineococcus indalonis TaxID=2696566 RepID=UPI001412DE45|nr:ABC transporter permease subunit [Kineococcus indalonis]NAZ85748.1 ABC transporter permease subunit [Kineococcus indalonis]
MSSATTSLSKTAPQYAGTPYRVTFPGLLRSEWIKFWSVRSVVVTVLLSVVAIVALGALLSWAVASSIADPAPGRTPGPPGVDATGASLQGAQIASLVLAAVGVIVIAGEYSTGMIRTSFTTAPGRLGVYAAKALVLAVSVALAAGLAVLAAFFVGQAVLDTQDAGVSIGDEGVLRAVAGHVVMIVGFALAGLGLGALMRNSAGAICTIVGAIFVVPLLLLLVPESWGGETVREYWFSNSITAMTTVTPDPSYLEPLPGALVFTAWVAVLLGLGALSLKTRDV